MTPDLHEQISRLEGCYGSPEPPAVLDPFGMILWESVAYLVDDDRRARVFARLRSGSPSVPRTRATAACIGR